MGIFDGIKRLFTGETSSEERALELTQRLAEAFSGDPDVEVLPPMTWEETIAYLKSLEVEGYEEEGE